MYAEHPNPKIRDIVPQSFKDFIDVVLVKNFNVKLRVEKQTPNLFSVFDQMSAQSCEVLLNSKEFKNWMLETPKIDLIIGDLVPECALGIAYKLNAKFILYNTVAFYGKMLDMVQVPDESLATYCDNPYKTTMSFFERVKNALTPLAWSYYLNKNIDYYERILKTGLELDYLPSLYDLQQNISLVFSTGNFISEYSRSLPPMFVSIPGLHLKTSKKPLSKVNKQVFAFF